MRRAVLLAALLLFSNLSFGQLNDLIITEYVDWNPGSGWAIKIYNPTGAGVNLSAYNVEVYNGNSNTPNSSSALSGTLAAGASIIISNATNPQVTADFLACSFNQTFNANGVNDDDGIALTKGPTNAFVDMVGLCGTGVKSRVAGVGGALKWQKLVRENFNCVRYTSITGSGANSWPNSSAVSVSGWRVEPATCISQNNTFNPSFRTVTEDTICEGDSILVHGQYEKAPGVYTVITSSPTGCPIIDEIRLAVNTVGLKESKLTQCIGDSILVENKWYFNDTLIKFTKPSGAGSNCDSLLIYDLTFSGPTASFTTNYQNIDSSVVAFNTSSSPGARAWFWDFGDGDTAQEINPTHAYAQGGWYTVTLTVYNQDSCASAYQKQVYIPFKDFEIPLIYPNVFSPNGDGINDLFFIADLEFYTGFNLSVYNRWGAILFSTSKPFEGWSGTFKGKLCPQGTYFYLLQLPNGKQVKKSLYLSR